MLRHDCVQNFSSSALLCGCVRAEGNIAPSNGGWSLARFSTTTRSSLRVVLKLEENSTHALLLSQLLSFCAKITASQISSSFSRIHFMFTSYQSSFKKDPTLRVVELRRIAKKIKHKKSETDIFPQKHCPIVWERKSFGNVLSERARASDGQNFLLGVKI